MIYLENMLFLNNFFITVKKTLILDDFGFFDVIFLFFMGVYREIAYYCDLNCSLLCWLSFLPILVVLDLVHSCQMPPRYSRSPSEVMKPRVQCPNTDRHAVSTSTSTRVKMSTMRYSSCLLTRSSHSVLS